MAVQLFMSTAAVKAAKGASRGVTVTGLDWVGNPIDAVNLCCGVTASSTPPADQTALSNVSSNRFQDFSAMSVQYNGITGAYRVFSSGNGLIPSGLPTAHYAWVFIPDSGTGFLVHSGPIPLT